MQLIQILKHGYSYTVNDGEDTRQVLVPPNKYMIAAAEGITKLIQENEARGQTLSQLQAALLFAHQECDRLRNLYLDIEAKMKELQDAETPIQNPRIVSADGDASSDFQRSTDKG